MASNELRAAIESLRARPANLDTDQVYERGYFRGWADARHAAAELAVAAMAERDAELSLLREVAEAARAFVDEYRTAGFASHSTVLHVRADLLAACVKRLDEAGDGEPALDVAIRRLAVVAGLGVGDTYRLVAEVVKQTKGDAAAGKDLAARSEEGRDENGTD